MDADRTSRYTAYQTVQAIVKEYRGNKLHNNEADEILYAAEGMLLAKELTDEDAVLSRTSFDTLMADLCSYRWKDNAPSAERLRAAFSACAPQPIAVI